MSAALIALIAFAVVAAVSWPLIQPRREEGGATPSDLPAVALQDAIDRSLRAIREIEFDHRAGNLSDEDFVALDRAERQRAAELLRRRESHSLGQAETSG